MKSEQEMRALIEAAVRAYPLSMAAAARNSGLGFITFRKYAKQFGLFRPNPHHKGRKLNSNDCRKVPIEKLISGDHGYQSAKLRARLIDEGLLERRCALCELTLWQGAAIALNLHHKDGNSNNNQIDNLQLLCPNCHSLTDTYGSRNKASMRKDVTDEELLQAYQGCGSIYQALRLCGLNDRNPNARNRLKKLLQCA